VDQVRALLYAAGKNRALLATAVMAGGLRVSELTGLRWRDVDLAGGWLNVAESKTAAGVREVEINPHLLDELKLHRASLGRDPKPAEFVFPGRDGGRRDRHAVRTRVLGGAVKRANITLAEAGLATIPEGVTFHSLRRTYVTLAIEAGADPSYVQHQVGHSTSHLTMGIYNQHRVRRHEAAARLGEMLA
jgi:integrase